MTLMPLQAHPLEEAWVALDLETTGLSRSEDTIIEVGAVKFLGDKVIDTFQTFVNPNRKLSDFIVGYTGIKQTDVDDAPSFSAVAPKFSAFIGSCPVVGHNIPFDLGFLETHNLKISNPRCDTWDLAFVLRPGLQEYALARMAVRLEVSQPSPHRALDDASATMGVFLKLIEQASDLDTNTLAEMQRLASRSGWVLDYVLKGLQANAAPTDPILAAASRRRVGVTGIDNAELSARLRTGGALRAARDAEAVDVDFVTSLLKDDSALSAAIAGFEERAEQVQMAEAVTNTINKGGRLIVEAGTGVGKSMAYLLPSLLYGLQNNKRIVVSTNTIALQEQLVSKDIPALVEALESVSGVAAEYVKFCQLKGRANYICLRRWAHLRASETLNEDEARMLAKTMMWLGTTESGDRSELNLGSRRSAAPWDRISAVGATECLSLGGPCFLKAARENAASAHIVVVNHALLMSDVVAGSTLIPDYDVLIVDEAHHLEEEATRHLGFEVGQMQINDLVSSLTGDRGLLKEAVDAFRGSTAAATRRQSVEEKAAEIIALLGRVRDEIARSFLALGSIASLGNGQERDFRVTPSTRAQPAWSDLEIEWDNADLALMELGNQIRELGVSLEGLEDSNLINYDGINMEISNARDTTTELRAKLTEFFSQPKQDGIYWVTRHPRSGDLAVHAAPLHVGETLEEMLFSQKESVVLTSATLSTNGTFDHMVERTGFADADQLMLGSPFDYPNAAMICVPQDMPEPNSWAYQTAIEEAVVDAAVAAGGRTMALFTSHASLQTAASSVRHKLALKGITVLAQGLDGSPNQIVRRFLDNPSSVILGTASFWEGVDLPGDSLMVLLVSRLPFSVPSDPVFSARSELYDNSFMEYAVPQAILRLRQGFGRLIRTKTDRGVAIMLDKRITSRRYGKAFLKSLPPAKLNQGSLFELSEDIRSWVGVK